MASPAVQPEVSARLSLYELSQTTEFGHLSPKMANWVLTYLQSFIDTGTFDPLAATKFAYNCRSDETARTFGYQLMANPKILIALNRFFGKSPERAFLDQVERAIYKRKLSVAQVDALKLYSDLQGWSSGIKWPDSSKPRPDAEPETAKAAEAPKSTTTFHVGELVTQRDGDGVLHTGRVLAIDATGRPTQIEEVK